MRYFKILDNSEYIGVASSDNFRKYQKTNNIMIGCDDSDIEYIQYDETFYHDVWMKAKEFLPSDRFNCADAYVIEITEEEYTALNNAKENKEMVEQLLEPQKEEKVEEIDPAELTYVKEAKIQKLRTDCQNAIVSGVDIEFADNSIQHFSMELTDQIEVQRLVTEKSFDDPIPYHADDDIFRYYAYEDIIKLYNAMNDWKLYNTSYFNDLKRYVNSMHSMKEVDGIEYGCDIPEEYQSEIFKDIKEKLNL